MKLKYYLSYLLPIFVMGCLSGAEKSTAQKEQKKAPSKMSLNDGNVSKPRVQEAWQKEFYQVLEKEAAPSSQAWALFSYGGWADRGQIMIFKARDQTIKIYLVNTGSKTINLKKSLTSKQIRGFMKELEPFSSFKDHESTVMDGVNWEYTLAHIDEKNIPHIHKRIYMNNPGVDGQGKEHAKLVQLFLELRSSIQKK